MSRVISIRRAGTALGVTAVLVTGLGRVKPARADSANPNFIPFGETEQFLGNAGVGRANDTGAVFYNPSGLAELGTGRISVSGSVYLSYSQHTDAYVHFDNTDVPFNASGFDTIPSTYVATRSIGDWVGALSILVPTSRQLDNRVPFTTSNYTGNIVYSQGTSELWFGLSGARRIDEHWSVGLSVFGIKHDETLTSGLDIEGASIATNLAQYSFTTFGLAATAGVTYIASDWARFGLRAQSALVPIYGKGDSYAVTHPLDGGTPTGEDVHGPATYSTPFDFTLGSALSPAPWFCLLADLSLQLGDSYTFFPASTYLNTAVSLKPTPRFNLGMEVTALPAVPFRFGIFYDPSANSGQSGDLNYQRSDYYGVTFGVGLNDAHIKTTAGAFYVWSTGEATPLLATGETSPLTTRGIGAMLTTAYVF